MSSTFKPRQAFTDTEKREMYEWVNSETEKNGTRPEWKKIQTWFANTHGGKVISQSTISKTLTKRAFDQPLANPNHKKRREIIWPKLDEALFEWHKRMEKRIPISGMILKEKARGFFSVLHPGEEPPKFSDGWLDTWKKRHNIKEYKQHGQSGSAECEEGKAEMQEIRRILQDFDLHDTYNFDETGYYYRLQPDRRLCTEQLEGVTKDKLQITVALTCNGTGTHKLPPWVIGTAKDPRCFKNINRRALGVVYRYNKTAWMRSDIMVEFLHWFDRKMHGRKVALLMDNFSAHELGVNSIGGVTALQNTLIIWLPANTTSKWQPLDQGIINAWKAHTRRHFVRYLVRVIEKVPEDRDVELPKINILQAIRWAVEAWNNDVKPSTIFNCFTKSSVKLFEPSHLPSTAINSSTAASSALDTSRVTPIPDLDLEDEAEMQAIQDEIKVSLEILKDAHYIQEPVNVKKFLNPIEEQVIDDPNLLEEHILNSFLPEDLAETAADEENEVQQPVVEVGDALKYLDYLEILQLQQETPNEHILNNLIKMKRDVETRRLAKMGNQRQNKITMYFK